MSEENELVYDPQATIVLVDSPHITNPSKYTATADEIVRNTRAAQNRINILNSYYNIVKEFLEKKLSEGDDASADFDDLADLAKELDVEVTKSVNLRVDAQFEIEVEIPIWDDARTWGEDNLEFDLCSDGSITYVDIQSVDEV